MLMLLMVDGRKAWTRLVVQSKAGANMRGSCVGGSPRNNFGFVRERDIYAAPLFWVRNCYYCYTNVLLRIYDRRRGMLSFICVWISETVLFFMNHGHAWTALLVVVPPMSLASSASTSILAVCTYKSPSSCQIIIDTMLLQYWYVISFSSSSSSSSSS